MLGNRTGRMFPAVFLLIAAARLAGQTQPPRLHDGESFALRGKLKIVYSGWQRYLVLPLERPYVADFGPGVGTKEITAIEINPQGHYASLAEHAGEVIEVLGKLQMEGVSPYYWNGVMLVASTVRLPDGATLHPEMRIPRVPSGTEFYTVTLALVPHQFEWRREAYDIETGQLLPDSAVDGCSLNGGGDVMNCLCIPGFAPVRAGVVPHPLPPPRWKEIPSPAFALPGMAQFTLPDHEATQPQIVQMVEIACKRKGRTAK